MTFVTECDTHKIKKSRQKHYYYYIYFCSLLYNSYNKDTPIIGFFFIQKKREKIFAEKVRRNFFSCDWKKTQDVFFFLLHGDVWIFVFSRMYDYLMKLDYSRPLVAIFSASLCPPFEGHLIGVLLQNKNKN